ncbi:MAG TPA: thioesterase family protein [Acidimicrobiia bacterium]|jgi:acyl-CoA thioesterase
MAHLDDALALVPAGDGQWRAHADADHESISAMFGGWTAAVLLRAARLTAESEAQPSALTVNFIRPVAPGTDVSLTASRLGGGRSLEHWRADLRAGDGDGTEASELLATALVVFTNRRASEAHVQFEMPAVPAPEGLEQIRAPGPQGQQTEIRQVAGEWGSGDTRGCVWARDQAGRALDHLQLAYLADQYAPRSFFWGVGMRPSATITLSVYFHATAEELTAVGTDYILNQATGTRGEHSTSGQQARLWSRDGVLLATTEQLCWYR